MSTTRKRTPARSRKAALVRALAALQGKDLLAIARKARVHHSVFYRVVRGERTSARIDGILSRELGIDRAVLRGLGRE